MKLILEVLVSIILHPVAMVLSWIDILLRQDLSVGMKVLWGVLCVIWGIGPILYILIGGGQLWPLRQPSMRTRTV